ncbi:MAG: N-6 DNA methylase, partial [Candidatus Hodarchaeales archaeon]
MLRLLDKKYKREKGQFFTPKEIVLSMLDRMKPHIAKSQNSDKISILDPAMGEGIFFKSLIPLLNDLSSEGELFGIDIDEKVLNIALKDLKHQFPNQQHQIHVLNSNFLL